MLKNNLSALILGGSPDNETIEQAWRDILREYTEAIGSHEYIMFLNVYREYEEMKTDFSCITEILIPSLRLFYSKYFCDELNRMLRLTCTFNPKDKKTFKAELDKCQARIGGIEIRLQLKESEYKSLRSKIGSKDGGDIDQNYFTSVLIILSRFNGYGINKDIFMNWYCEHIKQLSRYNEEVRKAIGKK